MAVPENEYIVLPEVRNEKEREEQWFEILRRWLVQCPECSQARLVVGARQNDRYVCKDCGHSFNITRSTVAKSTGNTTSRDQ